MEALKNAFIAGGWGMWSTLLFGGLALATAVRYALKTDARKLSIIRALSLATLYSTLVGMCSGFIAVSHYVDRNWAELKTKGEFGYIVLQGLGEIANLPALGFMLLTLTWLFVAVGTRRLQERDV